MPGSAGCITSSARLPLAVVMTAVCFAIASYAIQNTPRGTDPSVGLIAWPVIVSILVFLWITFTLQSMRIRDIGWDPVCVIPAWIALLIVDKLVAGKIPAWSLGPEHQGTIVGALISEPTGKFSALSIVKKALLSG